MCVHVCACLCMCVHVCAATRLCVHVCVCVCVQMRVCACVYVHACVCRHVYMCVGGCARALPIQCDVLLTHAPSEASECYQVNMCAYA